MSRTTRTPVPLSLALVTALVTALLATLLVAAVAPAAPAAAAAPGISFDLEQRALPGQREFVQGYLSGPAAVPRPVLVQQRRGGGWATVVRDRSFRGGEFIIETRTPRRTGPVTWRVVAPRVRAGGRVLRRLVSRSVRQQIVVQRLVWKLPASAEVGTRVLSPARLRPFVVDQTLALEQLVNGHWQHVAGIDGSGNRFDFVQLASGATRYRVQGSDGRYTYKTLRGTPTDVVLPTRRLSTTSNGSQTGGGTGFFGSADATDASASDDGRWVAFTSSAVDAVPGDTNGVDDVFLKDTATGRLLRVAHGPRGAEPNGLSRSPSVSGDGRFVAFVSRAANLVPGNRARRLDAYVWERGTGTITRVGRSAAEPSISADGRWVAFTSGTDVLLRDRTSGTLTRVSRTPAGAPGNGRSRQPAVSADGRHVAFTTAATDLTAEAVPGVLLWDRTTATSSLVAARASSPQVDADGSVVAYVAGDQPYRRDLATATTTQLSTSLPDPEGLATTVDAVSADGSVVLFSSAAPLADDDVDDGDCPSEAECYYYENFTDTYVYRAATGAVSMASRSAAGRASDYYSLGQDLLADGSGAVFLSRSVLVPGQVDRGGYYSVHGYLEVFVRDLS
ncbi:hypothetical protein [Nocardioides sp.]|uniref:hypothetical protein n=1 Tax=Nocardioides sp. TaxID=35761 RepID=UPI0027159C01|nr:hypothetical protein [Nocardioides sp.]MDO9457347.1 hypothetical protein [Nocardioides sp.]